MKISYNPKIPKILVGNRRGKQLRQAKALVESFENEQQVFEFSPETSPYITSTPDPDPEDTSGTSDGTIPQLMLYIPAMAVSSAVVRGYSENL